MPAFPTSTTVLDSILFRDAFGHKTAIWLAMFGRHAERLAQLKPRELGCAIARRDTGFK